jgi:spore germination protein KC
MKKLGILTISILLCVCSFTSCIPSRQLNETAIVQAIGIDQLDNGDYELTLQIYSPKGPGANTGIDSSKNNANVLSVTGKTISEALDNAVVVQGEGIFTGQNRLLIIGETLAKNGVQQILSYFDRSRLTRQNIEVLVAKGNAKDIVSVNIEQGILAAETIEKMVENGEKNSYLCRTPYYLFTKSLYLYQGCAVVPIVELSEEQKNDTQSTGESQSGGDSEKQIESVDQVEVKETAIFRDYCMVDVFDTQLSQGLAYLNGGGEKSVVIAQNTDGWIASISLKIEKSKLVPQIEDDNITFCFSLQAEGEIDEIILPEGESVGYPQLHEFEEKCQEVISNQCKNAFVRAIYQDKSDILYLGDLVMKEDKELWKLIEDDFYDNLDQIEFKTDISVEIKQIGMEANAQ